MREETEIEHGIGSAYYSSSLSGIRAVLEYLCGETFDGGTPSWEDAGAELDRHLNEVE